ncbi:MAG: glycosyltransferase [Methanococcaceae archaeon]
MTEKETEKTAVAVFLQKYWGNKMSFVERQLNCLSSYYKMLVITPVIEVPGTSPEFEIYAREKLITEKAYSLFYKNIFSRFTILSFSQKNYFKKVLRENGVKLIHAHFGPAGFQVLPLAKALNIPLVVTFHGYDASKLFDNKVYNKNIREVFNYAHILCVSAFMRRKLIEKGADPERVQVNYLGIPLNNFRYTHRESPAEKHASGKEIKFLQVANFQEKKGHIYTIRVFKRLLGEYPNLRLTLVGSGQLESQIKSLCISEGINERVTFTGNLQVKEIIKHMEEADIFLHHSVTTESGDQEGIPTSIMEAMATGLPVISTVHAGIPELVQDGATGFLVPEKDEEAYFEKIRLAINIDNQMGLKAYEFINENFNLDIQTEKLSGIYNSLISA